MWSINNGWLVKGDSIFQVLAWFNATSYLSDVFISELEEAVSDLFQNSAKRQKHSKNKSKLFHLYCSPSLQGGMFLSLE